MPDLAPALDPRFTLARPDLADQALEGVLSATVFQAPRRLQCVVPVANLVAAPDDGSPRLDQLLFGERFDALDERDGFVWGQARRDGMVGWVSSQALGPAEAPPTHRMAQVGSDLPLNALCQARPGAEPIGQFESDPVLVAERLLGTPHEPGARSSLATDCSGLVQQALYACGRAGPRNADEQAQLGQAVSRSQARRGDLVVWPYHGEADGWTGHSALMLDDHRVIHASGTRGSVVIEPFDVADEVCRANGFEPPVFRRLSPWA